MMISVTRTKDGRGLILKAHPAGGTGRPADEYEQTIHADESALGFTYQEWDAAVGSHRRRRVEVTEDGSLRPASDEDDAPG